MAPCVRLVVASDSSMANCPTASFHDPNTAFTSLSRIQEKQALLKARHRGTRSVISIAGELNMSAGTLRKWLQSAGKKTGTIAHPAPGATAALDGPASAWSPAQRLMALQQSYALDDMARAGWYREHGVFEHQLAQWRQEFCTLGRLATAPRKRRPTTASRRCSSPAAKGLLKTSPCLAPTWTSVMRSLTWTCLLSK